MFSTELPNDLECFKMFNVELDSGHNLYTIQKWRDRDVTDKNTRKKDPLADHKSPERRAVVESYAAKIAAGTPLFEDENESVN